MVINISFEEMVKSGAEVEMGQSRQHLTLQMNTKWSNTMGQPLTLECQKENKLYLCSKREVLGFYKQVTYMRPGDEPFFYFRVHQSCQSAEKWPIFDQKRPCMAGLLLTQPKQVGMH